MASCEFDRCAPWIAAALNYSGGTHHLDDIREAVRAGEAQLWPGHRAAVVTEVITYPRKRVCNFFLAGGDLDELLRMLPVIEQWARDMGCAGMTIQGRPGWKRVLGRHGYAPFFQALGKEL